MASQSRVVREIVYCGGLTLPKRGPFIYSYLFLAKLFMQKEDKILNAAAEKCQLGARDSQVAAYQRSLLGPGGSAITRLRVLT